MDNFSLNFFFGNDKKKKRPSLGGVFSVCFVWNLNGSLVASNHFLHACLVFAFILLSFFLFFSFLFFLSFLSFFSFLSSFFLSFFLLLEFAFQNKRIIPRCRCFLLFC